VITEAFDKYARALIGSQHALINGDEAALQRFGDEMEEAYKYLDRIEERRIRALASDLYLLSDRERFHTPQFLESELIQAANKVDTARDGDALLHLSRQTAGKNLGFVAHMRSRAYDFVGYLPAAIVFREEAVRRSAGHYGMEVLLLELLIRDRRLPQAIALGRSIISRNILNPDIAVFAGGLFYRAHEVQSWAAVRSVADEVINAIAPHIESIERDSVMTLGLIALSATYRTIGNYTVALAYADRVVEMHPTMAYAWGLRGWIGMLSPRSDESEYRNVPAWIGDFEQAVRLKSDDPIAYIFVARERLEARRFDEAKRLARRALELATGYRRALAYEIVATASAQQGKRDSEAILNFEMAIECDPDNSRLAENYAEFVRTRRVATVNNRENKQVLSMTMPTMAWSPAMVDFGKITRQPFAGQWAASLSG